VDFNGVWELPYTPDLSRAFGGPLPFTPLGEEKYKTHLGGDDPHGFCQPTGPTRAFHSPFPFQLVQSAGMTVVLFEIDHNFRRIFTDGRDHPKDLDTTWYGDSIGHYEGNKLTVDTIGISGEAGSILSAISIVTSCMLLRYSQRPALIPLLGQ
jgi:hypothetical protein